MRMKDPKEREKMLMDADIVSNILVVTYSFFDGQCQMQFSPARRFCVLDMVVVDLCRNIAL